VAAKGASNDAEKGNANLATRPIVPPVGVAPSASGGGGPPGGAGGGPPGGRRRALRRNLLSTKE
jgi:hypothetical protein